MSLFINNRKNLADGLHQTRSSYIKPDPKAKRGKSMAGRVAIIALLLVISLVVIVFLGSPTCVNGVCGKPFLQHLGPVVGMDLLLFGALLTIVGWIEFSLSEIIKGIPTSKIEGAAAGLNEISASFIPEGGEEMVSPLSNTKCIYYSLQLERLVRNKNSSNWVGCGWASYGMPALLTDGTGYLAVDLSDADLKFPARIYYPYDPEGKQLNTMSSEGKALRNAFATGRVKDELANISMQYNANMDMFTFQIGFGEPMRLVESVAPTNTPFFVIGRIDADLGKREDKPVKMMSYDPRTKLLSVRDQSKKTIERNDELLSLGSLGFGILILLAGFALVF